MFSAYTAIVTITPKYAMDIGLNKADASLLISAIGVANIIGRVAAGFISNKPQVCSLYLIAGALFGGCVALCFLSFTDVFVWLLLEAAVLGACVGEKCDQDNINS